MKLLPFLFLILFFVSCEQDKVIRIDGTNSLIVVNSVINTDSLIKINLSKSVDLSIKDTVLHLDNALIKIFCNDTLKEEIRSKGEGVYLASFKPQLNKNYKIEVGAENFKSVISKTTIPEKPNIISVVADSSRCRHVSPRVKITIKDNPSTRNYYYLTLRGYVYHYDTGTWDSITQIFTHVEPDSITGEYPLKSITLEQLRFVCEDNSILGKSNPTTEEILNSGGYIGVTMDYIAFSDGYFNGKEHTFQVFIDNYRLNNIETHPIYVELKSISEEYYNYLKSREYISRTGTSPLSNLVRVSNNIEGGAGIFGAYNLVRDSITTILPAPKK